MNYLVVPVPKYPYTRIGPKKWQDWYRQVEYTIRLIRKLKHEGNEVHIAILSNFKPASKPSEIEMYTKLFDTLAPELKVMSYRETYDTKEQIERVFELSRDSNITPVFVSTWMHYLRVRYVSRGHEASHHMVFGIPQPLFFIIDIFCLIFQPITDFLGITEFFRKSIRKRREKGTIL